MGHGTALKPFRVPETRLLAINELVAQVTLTYRTDEDEEVRYRYERDGQLQLLVQTAVVSLVNCGYTNGVARGPGFVLHQLRKKWPIGRRYIFTRDGEPLQSSLHKYFFQLELVDDGHDERPVLEITELRGVAQSVSSVAGSAIEGLEAVPLPPMAAIFGQSALLDSGDRRRSGSAFSARSGHSSHSVHSSYSTHRPRSPFYYDAGGRTSRQSVYAATADDDSAAADGLADVYRSTERLDAQRAAYSNGARVAQHVEQMGSSEQGTVRTRSISRSSVGSMQSVEQLVENTAVARGQPGGNERLGRTSWYRSLHGISPLSHQQKSLSSSDNEAILGAVPASVGVSRIPRVAGAPSALRPAPVPPVSPGLSSMAQRLRRKILSPISMPRQRQLDGSSRQREPSAEYGRVPPPRPAPAMPVSATTPEKRKLEAELPSPGIRRPDMPPPSKRPVPRPRPQMEEMPESVSIPAAVKNALLRRLKSPLGRRPDKSSSRLSVRERIAAFDSLTVDNKESTHGPAAEAAPLLTPVTHESADGDAAKGVALLGAREPGILQSRISMPTTPVSAGRVRVGTSTGFVSVAAGRPLSRASTNNGRAASPALSQMSTVSARIQDTINALERASSGTPAQSSTNRSGTKRAANGPVDSLTSPTKRPRAPSAAEDPRRNGGGGSRLNPINMVNRLVRRNTDR